MYCDRTTIAVAGSSDRMVAAAVSPSTVRVGGILMSVHCDNSDWVDRAKEVMKQTAAEDVSSTSEAGADFDKTDKPHRELTGSGRFVHQS